jgi:hypothetical protein
MVLIPQILSPVSFNSFSSSLIFGTTVYRNQYGIFNKFIAQAGYALTAVVAAIETLAALAFSALTLIVYPFSSTPFERSITWLGSCVFSFGWSIIDFILNPFLIKLVADEESARLMLDQGDLLDTPDGAVFHVHG